MARRGRRTGAEGIAEEGELFCTHIGGSATIEGVMMRGKLNWAVAVRCPDGGMYVEEHDLPDAGARPRWQRLPVVRGCVSFVESMRLSLRAMDIAAAHAYDDDDVDATKAPAPEAAGEARAAAGACGAGAPLAATGARTDDEGEPPRSGDTARAGAEPLTGGSLPDGAPESGHPSMVGGSPVAVVDPRSVPSFVSESATSVEAAASDRDVIAPASTSSFAAPVPTAAGTSVPAPDGATTVRSAPDGSAPSGPIPDGVAPSAAPASERAAGGLTTAEFALSVAVGIVLGAGLFMALPVFLANLALGPLTPANALPWNLVEAAVRIVLLIVYVAACRLQPDMARLFGYHGAEHQAIHCFEHGEPLTPAACARYSRLHVRCGTAFLVMTVAVAIVVNSVVPVAALADALGIAGLVRNLFVFASRLVLLPLVAGLSYEVTVKWAGAHPDLPLVRAVLWPGLQMQRLTTSVPDAGMLECAIAALERVDARECRAVAGA